MGAPAPLARRLPDLAVAPGAAVVADAAERLGEPPRPAALATGSGCLDPFAPVGPAGEAGVFCLAAAVEALAAPVFVTETNKRQHNTISRERQRQWFAYEMIATCSGYTQQIITATSSELMRKRRSTSADPYLLHPAVRFCSVFWRQRLIWMIWGLPLNLCRLSVV